MLIGFSMLLFGMLVALWLLAPNPTSETVLEEVEIPVQAPEPVTA